MAYSQTRKKPPSLREVARRSRDGGSFPGGHTLGGLPQSAPEALSLSKNTKNEFNGKEESYERNPGRVPFVFNQKFSELPTGSENLLRLAKRLFRQPEACIAKLCTLFSARFLISRTWARSPGSRQRCWAPGWTGRSRPWPPWWCRSPGWSRCPAPR